MKNNSYINEVGLKIVFWAAVIVLFLPVIVLPPYFQPSDWTRSILFRIIVTILISFLLFAFFYKKNLRIEIPKWNKALYLPILALAAYLATVLIATLFSQDVRFSIFGSPSRAGGALNLVFFLLFAVLAALFISKTQWQKLFHALFIGGVLASLLAIVQYFNLLKNVFLSYEGGSTPSFLGNSTILATYMLFLTFLSFTFFIQKQKKKEKIFYGALFLLFIFTILITGSRAAYLGLLAGFLYFFLFYPVRNTARRLAPLEVATSNGVNAPKWPTGRDASNGVYLYPKKYKILKIAAFSILFLAIFTITLFNFFPHLGQKNSVLNIIATRVSVTRIAKDIFGTRLSAWEMTWQAIQEKPFLGWGPENFYIGFEKHYDPVPFATPKLLWDRPHNILLDVVVHSGIMSLLLYLFFWIALFWKLQQVKRFQREDGNHAGTALEAHGVQAMFMSYLVVLFFNFDSFATYLISFFFIGYSFYLISLQKEALILLPPQKIFFPKKTVAVAYITTLIIFIWFWNIKPLYFTEKVIHAKNLSEAGHCKKALEVSNNLNWAKSGIVKSYATLLYSDIVKSCAFIEPQKEVEYSKKIVSLLKINTNVQPTFSRTWLFMGGFTNILAAREENAENKSKLLAESMEYLRKALQLSPGRQETFAEMEKNYLVAENYTAMEKLGKECVAIDPRFGECYWYLGIAQIFLGNQEEGKKNIELALSNGYTVPPYKQLAVAYMSQKNWEAATAAYEKIPIYYDQVSTDVIASHHATLAYLYKQSGNYTRAGEEALKVFRLQPDNPETVQFIKLLLEKSPSDTILNSSLAFIYQQPGPQRELRKAIAVYQQLIANDPKNVHYYSEVANMYHELKEYDRAYAQVILIVKLFPIQRENVEGFIKKKLLPIHWHNYTHGVGF